MQARGLVLALCSLLLCTNAPHAGEHQVFECATSEEVREALTKVQPGDTIMLQGGNVYEIDESFELRASGKDDARISFTSRDSTGQDRFAVITTVGQKKEENVFALNLTGSFWSLSRLEIAGKRVPLEEGYWDTNGFRIGLYLLGRGSYHNVVEDVHIHHTHNTAVAVRDESHDNTFRRMKIHHIGEWLNADYNAHEGEGFYIGSSKGLDQAGNKAKVHDILIEDSILGPSLLGQYVDLKYGTSRAIVRNNTFVPVRVDYDGKKDIPAPTGRDNTVVDNVFYTNDSQVQIVQNDLAEADRASFRFENNRIEPLDE